MFALILFVLAGDASAAPRPQAFEVAPGVHVIPGAVPLDRGPDGNSVILEARDGLIVVDTGRHVWHSEAILAFADARGRPITAIVNTHWHLDHTSGNRRLKARFPNALLFATSAIDRALAPGGFLERGVASARERLADPTTDPIRREETENFLVTMDASEFLRANVVIDRATSLPIGRRGLDVHVTEGAVSDADIWLYDRRTRVAILGDLVTFPSPFFESACPDAWRRALNQVWATPFRVAIPGHGEPMTRPQFDTYRLAFNGFMDCVDGDAEPSACAAVWVDGAAQFFTTEAERAEAIEYASYYVEFLRHAGGKSPDCLTS